MSNIDLEKVAMKFEQIIGTRFEKGIDRKAITKWDSLNHVKLILSLEKEFKIKFSSQEAVGILTTDDLIKTLSEKCQKAN